MNSHRVSRPRSINGDASQYLRRSAPSLPRKAPTTFTVTRISITMRSKLAARVWSRRLKGLWGGSPQDRRNAKSLEIVYFGECEKLKIDPDGRTVLPKRLRDHAGITETAVFVGLGNKFQIWEPEAYNKFRERAREQALALRRELGAGNR